MLTCAAALHGCSVVLACPSWIRIQIQAASRWIRPQAASRWIRIRASMLWIQAQAERRGPGVVLLARATAEGQQQGPVSCLEGVHSDSAACHEQPQALLRHTYSGPAALTLPMV